MLVHGELTRTVLTPDLNRVLRLEGCLGGRVPDNKRGLGSLPPVCREIADLKPAKVVYGPATFINTAVGQIQDEFQRRQQRAAAQAQQASEAARRLSKRRGDPRSEQERLARAAADAVQAQFINETLRQALKYGISWPPGNQRPRVRFDARVRPDGGGGGRAEVAVRVPVPVQERRADPDPPAAGPDRGRAGSARST